MDAAGRRRRRTRRATVWNTQNNRQRQQSRQRYAAGGFAFVPHSCRFLGRQSLGVEPAVKGSSLHLVPMSSVPRKGDARPDHKDCRSDDGFFAASGTSRYCCGKRKAPTGVDVGAEFHPTSHFGDVRQSHCAMPEEVRPQYEDAVTKPLDRCSGYPQNSLRQSCLDANCSLVPLAFARIAAISRYTADTQELLLERCVVSPRNRTSRNVLRFSTAPPVAMSRQLRQQSR
jgi:hypothetical protein